MIFINSASSFFEYLRVKNLQYINETQGFAGKIMVANTVDKCYNKMNLHI